MEQDSIVQSSCSMEIVQANRFSLEELAEAYNQTRIDYIVPMPMNVERLREYIRVYDIDLSRSCAAVEGEMILGIGMLGVREKIAWITRLGVLPSGRRKGTGGLIMKYLVEQARAGSIEEVWLEVIQGNNPAHDLFRSFGFVEVDELVVARRPPMYAPTDEPSDPLPGVVDVKTLDHQKTVQRLTSRVNHFPWTNQSASAKHLEDLSGLHIKLEDGAEGWIAYHASLLRLTRIIVHTVAGDPAKIASTALHFLHRLYPNQDAIAENVSIHDPHWQGFQKAGYFAAFQRIEMLLRL